MYYISPFTLLGIAEVNDAPVERRDLQLAKKKMLAEIELSDTQTVKINEKEFSKDEILKIFEELEDERVVEFHRIIARDKAFLQFLEKGVISDYNNLRLTAETQDQDFIDFVSPYFRERYEPELNRLFKSKAYPELGRLLKTNRFMNMSDEEACFKKVFEEVNERIEKIHELHKAIHSRHVYGITVAESAFYSRNYLGALSQLPDFFMELRNRLAQALIILYVEAYNILKRPDISGEIVRNLSALKVDEEMKQEIGRREQEYNNASESAGSYSQKSSRGGKSPVMAIIIGVVLLIKVLLLTKTCGGSRHSDYSYPYKDLSYLSNLSKKQEQKNSGYVSEQPENTRFISFLDSVYRTQKTFVKKISASASTSQKSQQVYQDVLRFDENGSDDMADTGKVVFYNESDFEVCVFLSSASGARAWNIIPGDSVVALSRDKKMNVYYVSGYKLESKKKFKEVVFDENRGVFSVNTENVKTYRTILENNNYHLSTPKKIDMGDLKNLIGNPNDPNNFTNLRIMMSLRAMGKIDGLINYRKKIIFTSDQYNVSMAVRDAATLKKAHPSSYSRTP